MARRLNPCSYLPRRLQIVASLLAFCVLCIVLLGSSNPSDVEPYLKNVPYGTELQAGAAQAFDAAHQVVDSLPKIPANFNPFRAPSHKPPPEQANSTSGDAKWFSDFKWQNSFSSSITLDEDRSVLPPEKNRPAIYTYFDISAKNKDERVKSAELELLHAWRRAWWAQGFKPVVLGPGEAMSNPMYRKALGLKLVPDVETEMLRWLAWGHMGSGILCNWLALPMAPYDDPFLTFLRHGDYPILSTYPDLDNGLFIGSKADIEKALKLALDAKNIKDVKDFVEAIPKELLVVDRRADSIAYYSSDNLEVKYQPIKEKLVDAGTVVEGLTQLASLINSHLHTTWQSQFTSGIHVLKPVPARTTTIIEPAIEIARNLSQCPFSPLPNSCPPNNPKCRTCVASQPLALSTPPVFRNSSTIFTIATLPHPYTLNCLYHQREGLNLKFVRRSTARDRWILEATKELLGTGLSSFARLVRFKDAVASDYSQARTLWLTAETPFKVKSKHDADELDWIFGFQLPRDPVDDGRSETPVPGPERRPPPPKPEFGEAAPLTEVELAAEKRRLRLSQKFIEGSGGGGTTSRGGTGGSSAGSKKQAKESRRTKEFVEAWNLADTEAWKFVRAFNARRNIERQKWEEEERAFLGKGAWDRWIDKIT